LVQDGNWGAATAFAELFGGQGTINVNSWSPDGRRFAYVEYPMK
jgi:TolB protein